MTEPVTRPTLEGTAGHTPGPWRLDDRTVYGGPDEQSIAELTNRHHSSAPHNGALIAQAPALAAENQKLRDALQAVRGMVVDIEADVAADDWRAAYGRLTVDRWLANLQDALASAAPLLEGEGASR